MITGRVRRLRFADQGSVLMVTVMVAVVAMALTLVVTATAIKTQRDSGVDRQMSVSVAASEAGIDSAYAAIQNSGASSLPCSWPVAGPAQISTKPDATNVQAEILYQTGSGAAHCPLAAGEVPLSAVIHSVASTQTIAGGTTKGSRGMESAVNLTPIYGNGFDSALFADGTITVDNGGSLNGQNGSDADVYTNSNFECANGTNRDIHGSVYAQGDVLFADKCNVDGLVWAGGKVLGTQSSPTTIGGDVKAHNSASAALGISLQGGTTVGGQLTSSSITWPGCSIGPTKCTIGDPGAPLEKPFPILRADSDGLDCWTATAPILNCEVPGGFTLRPLANCATVTNDILAGAASWTTKSIVVTPCAVAFGNQTNFNAKNDIAIFARGGIRANQKTSLKNTGVSSEQRSVYWMVPYENGSAPCVSPTVTSEQQLTVASNVQLLMYSPCTVEIANNSTLYGQIYSGSSINATNSFDLTFRKVPVFGVAVESRPTLSYRLDVIFKREANG